LKPIPDANIADAPGLAAKTGSAAKSGDFACGNANVAVVQHDGAEAFGDQIHLPVKACFKRS
jgi:hypothetical protein